MNDINGLAECMGRLPAVRPVFALSTEWVLMVMECVALFAWNTVLATGASSRAASWGL